MMLHAGMYGQVPHLHGGLTSGQIEIFQPKVDYLALGHVHKRLQTGWVFNPGSLETNSVEEADWPHGFFDVMVDTEASVKHRVEAIETPGLRSFRRIRIQAEGHETLDEFVDLAERQIAGEPGAPERAVIEVDLGGVAGFKRQDVPIERIRGSAASRFSPLVVRIRNNLVPPTDVAVRHGERLNRTELERTVIEQMVYQNVEYRDRAAAWASLILDVKNMAANKGTPAATIADHVQKTVTQMGRETVPDAAPALTDAAGAEAPGMARLLQDW
jgi:DNA repair exonuclease SbcCD nuclease subunit